MPDTQPPADQIALRDRIRRAICEAEGFLWDTDMLEPDEYGDIADAVLTVLPAPASSAQSTPERPAPLSATDGPAPTPPEPHTGAQPPVPTVLHAALMRAGLTTQDARDEAARLTAEVRTAALNEAAAAADRIATAHREGEHGEEMTSREVRDVIETVAAELRTLAATRPDDTPGATR